MKVSLVMGVHNALEYVRTTLNQVVDTVNLRKGDNSLIVVDDASDSETGEYLWKFCHPKKLPDNILYSSLTYLRNKKQQLFTRTYNRGMRYAYHVYKPDIVVCLNSDLQLKPGWLDWMLKGFADPLVGMVGYRDQFDEELWKKKSFTDQRRPEYVTGHCLGLRVKMLEEIGIFCETDTTGRDSPELAPFKGQAHIGSDRVLSWKANMAWWKTLYCNFPGCSHEAGMSWKHDLGWLANFNLEPLWEANDTLQEPKWYE